MKLVRKIAGLMVISTVVTASLSNLYAKENSISEEMKKFDSGFIRALSSTGSGITYYDYEPQLSDIKATTIDSKLCISVHVQGATSISDVQIDSKSAKRRNGNTSSGDYYIEASGSKTYTIWARDINGRTKTIQQYITVNDTNKPSVSLSKKYKNGFCYLSVTISDESSISSVKINGTSKSFDSNGGTQDYRITESNTYTVEVKDSAGNTTTQKIDISVDDDKPSLTVDKHLKDGKWYLTIKSYPHSGARISKATVNNSQITFSSSGDTVEYAVPSTGSYNVVIIDSNNQQSAQTVYVDCNQQNDGNKPQLTAVSKDIGGVMAVGISVYPSANSKLTSVTVNGATVPVPATGGNYDHIVSVSGNYTVVATDSNGNTVTQVASVTVPASQTAALQNAMNSNGTSSSSTGSSKAVFKIKQKSYTLNGVKQSMEDGAPTIKNGRTMLPIRYVAYALNIEPKNIVWDGIAKIVTIYDGSNIIKAPLNSKKITVNGVDQTMEVPATMINGRVYIPISQIAKAFSGVSINWNSATKEATIIRN